MKATTTTATTAAAELVEDFNLYPRNKVDNTHVSDLERALQSGATLPPIVADKTSKRIVDGFHRRRAYLRVYGDEAMVPVQWKTYPDETALFMDAVSLNAAHGRKLDRHDQTRIVLKLQGYHVPTDRIAVALHVPEPTIQRLSVRVLEAPNGPMPMKRGFEHMRGQEVTAEQVEAMGSVRSGEVGRLCLELTRLLDNGLVDLSDDQTRSRLKALRSSLDRALAVVAA